MKPAKRIKIWQATYRSKFLLLFVGIVLSLSVCPFLEGSLKAFALSGIFFSFILVACIYSVSETRGAFLVSLILGIPSVLMSWAGIFLGNVSFQIAGAILQIIFWAFILLVILSHLLRVREVTADTIMVAAVGSYLSSPGKGSSG